MNSDLFGNSSTLFTHYEIKVIVDKAGKPRIYAVFLMTGKYKSLCLRR